MIFVTTYKSPDIDGIACCIGYSELLNKLGTKTSMVYFGDLSKEVKFVKKYTGYFPLTISPNKYPENSNISAKLGICYLNLDGKKGEALLLLEKARSHIVKSDKDYLEYGQSAPIDTWFYLAHA